jgi:molecular chaperone GrpE
MQMNIENSRDENGYDAVNSRESTVDINTDDNVAGTHHLNQELGEEDQVEKLQVELQEQKDKYLRLLAEFDNFMRRTRKEKEDLNQTAGKEIVVSLLDVLDDCDRAESQLLQEKDSRDLSGIMLVFNKLRVVLQNRGLKAMESLNTEFDVEKHEAIGEVPATVPDLSGKVVAEVMKGYYLNDKIIRFAKVIVGK